MKKLLLTLAMGLLAWSASAQNWTVGGRIGSGFQAVGQYVFSNDNYVEARFGAYWANAGGTVTADFSVLYNWNVCNMDWTPSAGRWFFDAGAGINVGGKGHYAYVGVAGSAKLGIAFKGAPVRLSFDWSPAFGPGIAYWDGDRIPSSTNGRCATSVLRAFIASKERTRGNKRSPEQFAPGFFMLSVRCFFCSIISPLLMKNVFRGEELRN